MLDSLEKQFISVGDINLHVVMAGPTDGEPVFLLHGFPEFWYGWKHQISFLADQGYRVIVPDQRGYNLSDKPVGVNNYTPDILAQDVANLMSALNYDKIILIGHDWGALVAWMTAMLFPDKLEKLVILNVPNPTVMISQMRSGNVVQWLKSWYIGFFQLPFIPETLVSLDDYAGIGRMLQKTSNPNTFTDEDILKYRRAWSQPNAMTSMMNWYRAIAQPAVQSQLLKKRRIVTPTLMLWGEKDQFLGKEMAEPSIRTCEDGELVFFPNATHWIQHEEADAVNAEIHRFISA